MKALHLTELSPEKIRELDQLYRTTHNPHLRTRVHIILLATEKKLAAAEIAGIVRTDEQTVRRWLKRYQEHGLPGLYDAPRPGRPPKISDESLVKLLATARRPPAELGLPFSHWTAGRLADYIASHLGIEVNPETVRLHLKKAGITLGSGQESAPSNRRRSTGRNPSSKT